MVIWHSNALKQILLHVIVCTETGSGCWRWPTTTRTDPMHQWLREPFDRHCLQPVKTFLMSFFPPCTLCVLIADGTEGALSCYHWHKVLWVCFKESFFFFFFTLPNKPLSLQLQILTLKSSLQASNVQKCLTLNTNLSLLLKKKNNSMDAVLKRTSIILTNWKYDVRNPACGFELWLRGRSETCYVQFLSVKLNDDKPSSG